MNLIRRIASALVSAICAAVLAAGLAYAALVHVGFHPEPVLTGSMQPTMPIGSLVVVKPMPASKVRIGDIVTFRNPGEHSSLITHRVVAIGSRHGVPVFRTRGDANPTRDPWALRATAAGTVGRVAFVVPYAGYLIVYAHDPRVWRFAIGALAMLLLASILRSIWRGDDARRLVTSTATHSRP